VQQVNSAGFIIKAYGLTSHCFKEWTQ